LKRQFGDTTGINCDSPPQYLIALSLLMNILITAISSATGPSGICRHAYSLVCCAISHHEISQVTVVVGKWQEIYFTNLFKIEDKKLRLITIDIPNNTVSRNLWYLRNLPILAMAVNADIIHLSFPVPVRRNMLYGSLVVSLHDLYPYDHPDNFGFPRVIFNRVFLQQCLNEADFVVCVSETTLSLLKLRFPWFVRRKSLVVHNSVNISSAVRTSPIPEGRPFFLMIAQHRSNKNIPMALEAFQGLLQEEKIDCQTLLLVVGNVGPETATIESMIKRSALERSVKLVNGLADEELRWLYKKSELVLVPSSTEGFGLPVAEGLLYGSRVVCSDIPALREVGGDACNYFVLRSGDGASALALAMCDALTKSAKPAENLVRFSLEIITRDLAVIYTQLKKKTSNMTVRRAD
jgi:glycosyltransferase involved in cell wall biosynthesis